MLALSHAAPGVRNAVREPDVCGQRLEIVRADLSAFRRSGAAGWCGLRELVKQVSFDLHIERMRSSYMNFSRAHLFERADNRPSIRAARTAR